MFTIKQVTMGHGERPKKMYLYQQDGILEAFYGFFLIQNEKYNILVDTCIPPKEYKQISGRELQDFKPFEQALLEVGLAVDDIDIVILTHLHFDHCGYLHLFKGKPIYVQHDELDHAHEAGGIDKHYHQPFYEGVDFILVDGTREIVEGVTAMLTPGHTPGCQSVIVEAKDGVMAISGFCCVLDNYRGYVVRKKPVPLGIYADFDFALDSIKKVCENAQEIYCVHDFGSVKL